MAGIYGVTLADLNNFMRTYPTGRIVPDQYIYNDTYDALKGAIKKEAFEGLFMETLIQTGREFTGRAHGSQVGIPYAGTSSFIKCFTPLRRLVVTAGVDQESMDRAGGAPGSWGNIVQRELDQMYDDFKIINEISALGHGDGALARSSTTATASDNKVTITCDNTYTDFGPWENTQLLRPGMRVEIYNNAGTNLTAVTETVANGASVAHVGCGVVTAVTPGRRTAAGSWAAVTGTVTIQVCSSTQATALAAGGGSPVDDGSIIYVYGTKSNSLLLPMGLGGLIQNASVGTYVDGYDAGRHVQPWVPSAAYGISAFDRVSYSQLTSMILDAADFGLASESPAAGTPTYWSLSVLRNAINDRENATGCKITNLVASQEIVEAMDRMNSRENNITVQVGNVTGTSQSIYAGGQGRTFTKSDGSTCSITISRNLAKHSIIGLGVDQFQWGVKGGAFDFFKLFGTEWQPVMGQRVDSFEAPYGGYSQLSADRVDHCFQINDLRYDI